MTPNLSQFRNMALLEIRFALISPYITSLLLIQHKTEPWTNRLETGTKGGANESNITSIFLKQSKRKVYYTVYKYC